MATLTGQNPKVFLIDKETGKKTEIKGVISTTNIHELIDEDLKSRLNIPKGPYTWTVKTKCRTHISRKMRKDFRRLFYTPREPKYIKKSIIVGWILEYDVTNIKTYEQLMKLSHRELVKCITPVVAMTILEGETSKRWNMSHHHQDFPSGGIVPRGDIRPNTGEMVIPTEQQERLRDLLSDNPN